MKKTFKAVAFVVTVLACTWVFDVIFKFALRYNCLNAKVDELHWYYTLQYEEVQKDKNLKDSVMKLLENSTKNKVNVCRKMYEKKAK